MRRKEEWIKSLSLIYGDRNMAEKIADRMEKRFSGLETPPKGGWLDERASVLITYGDSLRAEGEKGLKTLQYFMKKYVGDAISTIHILPMFPYTSDDGFSVIDYKKIDERLGEWSDIEALSQGYDLMFDAVVNHVSRSSEWFQQYLECEKPYKDYFITADPAADYSRVTRPRALPLLTEVETKEGRKYVWTTFSEDQIDLNFACPDVLIEIMEVLLTYANRGARIIRLDAVGFLWKEKGTCCMHLPQTHEIVKLARKMLEDYAPGTFLITETNVPQRDNISYFGNGKDEAHLIYQFALPPLTMFSILKADATYLIKWASELPAPEKGTAYFNFLSSHDGIGLRPAEEILNEKEIQFLVDAALRHGGDVSYKDNGDGTRSPYELNINYQDALAGPEDSDETRISRFLAAETILMSLQGVPGIYIHSILGSRNDYYGKSTSGIPRRINRERLDVNTLEASLSSDTNRSRIFSEMIKRLNIRREHSAFSPDASQRILNLNSRVFSLIRKSGETGEQIAIFINVSDRTVELCLENCIGRELIRREKVNKMILMEPYGCKWVLMEREDLI